MIPLLQDRCCVVVGSERIRSRGVRRRMGKRGVHMCCMCHVMLLR